MHFSLEIATITVGAVITVSAAALIGLMALLRSKPKQDTKSEEELSANQNMKSETVGNTPTSDASTRSAAGDSDSMPYNTDRGEDLNLMENCENFAEIFIGGADIGFRNQCSKENQFQLFRSRLQHQSWQVVSNNTATQATTFCSIAAVPGTEYLLRYISKSSEHTLQHCEIFRFYLRGSHVIILPPYVRDKNNLMVNLAIFTFDSISEKQVISCGPWSALSKTQVLSLSKRSLLIKVGVHSIMKEWFQEKPIVTANSFFPYNSPHASNSSETSSLFEESRLSIKPEDIKEDLHALALPSGSRQIMQHMLKKSEMEDSRESIDQQKSANTVDGDTNVSTISACSMCSNSPNSVGENLNVDNDENIQMQCHLSCNPERCFSQNSNNEALNPYISKSHICRYDEGCDSGELPGSQSASHDWHRNNNESSRISLSFYSALSNSNDTDME